MGAALMLSIQAFINMAVAVHLIPVTGQPLPLISRGGTSTLITCAYFGLILSADRFGMKKKKDTLADIARKETEVERIETDPVDESAAPVETIGALEDKVEFEIIQV